MDTEPLRETEGFTAELIPVDDVDAIMEHYAGRKVPLDQVYPDPPPPPADNPALDRAAHLPSIRTIAQDDPNTRIRIETEAAYRKEAQFKIIHRFLMRDGDMQQIGNILGVPLNRAYQLRRELFNRMGKEAGNIDMGVHSARTMAFYDEIRSTALRHHDAVPDGGSNVDRARFLALAMAAENNKHKFLQVAGFYDSVKLHPSVKEVEGPDDMAVLRQAMTAMLDPALHEAEIDQILDGGDGFNDVGDPDDWIKVL